MITVETLRHCAYLDSLTLESLLRKNYPKDRVFRSEFLGITNGNLFCYQIVYPDQYATNGMDTTKVFVWQDGNGDIVADY